MEVFSKNEKAYLRLGEGFECGFEQGLFPFKLSEITVPVHGQELTVRDFVKLPAGYGVRFWEIRNPKFPHWSTAFGDDCFVDTEPLFKAAKFTKNADGNP